MELKKIYEFGSNVDIRGVNGTKIAVLVYTKGRAHAKKMFLKNKQNISLPRKKKLEMAGIIEIKDEQLINACCYARSVYECIVKSGEKVIYEREMTEKINQKIRKNQILHEISAIDGGMSEAHLKMAIGAKAFLRKSEETKNKVWQTLGVSSDQSEK